MLTAQDCLGIKKMISLACPKSGGFMLKDCGCGPSQPTKSLIFQKTFFALFAQTSWDGLKFA
jgi:hypothetical protein